ncbi:MAG: DUF86 domain-containing protein [Nitrospirae bacterium]|uniref:HepT-like ribonuclease domain-containing protein n=1 Tax=Candidatus Magnetobacterium casense TaxID=1455061 RepID=UPI00058F7076|nr:HepT-like ribonuclease domain-containing protein [Candidatus Magnetobacterium casensis]MBF0336769.1 DUF86 domain-containing protein [Nitrospirota bacterium]
MEGSISGGSFDGGLSGIGNILRHNYENIAAPVMWKLVQDDLPALEKACREEMALEGESFRQ